MELMQSKTIMTIDKINFEYPTFELKDISFDVPKGSFFGIIGPNGSGKTTLLSLIMKFLKPKSGKILVNGLDISKLSHKKVAQLIAYIAQDFNPAYDFTVEEIVEMGGIAHGSFFESAVDEEKLTSALSTVDLLDYRKRIFSTLSGGQQRRVLIARAIYQDTPIILADELVNHLDIGQSVRVLDYLKKLTENGKTVVGTFHDIPLAVKYCDYIVVMKNGKIVSMGSPSEVITEKLLSEVYNISLKVIPNPAPNMNYPLIII
ncbi:MAG: ABC transporter ATP-binding protein [Fervidobacterium sp.]|uniref:ABC transporter ATP-binding protein n=1 Tax=Fervidobacterium TaxID=2422 RepID=UPI0030A7897B